jgi:hypothetical protein
MDQFAQGKNICTRVGLFPLQLLRRHVLERPHQHALAGQPGLLHGHFRQSRRQRGCARLLRQAEIHELGTSLGQHDVRGLQIAMRNTQLVGLG